MRIPIILLLSSCSVGHYSYKTSAWQYPCPIDYKYSIKTELCHYKPLYEANSGLKIDIESQFDGTLSSKDHYYGHE